MVKRKKKHQIFSEFELEALKLHNKYREIHHSPPLNLNKDLCKIAKNYSEKLAQNIKNIEYSFGRYKGKDMGENIYMHNGIDVSAEMVVDNWYNESKNHDFKKDYQKGTEHFTQMIWKDTKEVGFGIANKGNRCFVVANYYPPGNFLGLYDKNVLQS